MEHVIDFVGGVEAQLLASKQVYRLPARHDLPADRVPAWVAEVEAEMAIAPMDWGMLARRGAGWMGYWDRHVRGSGSHWLRRRRPHEPSVRVPWYKSSVADRVRLPDSVVDKLFFAQVREDPVLEIEALAPLGTSEPSVRAETINLSAQGAAITTAFAAGDAASGRAALNGAGSLAVLGITESNVGTRLSRVVARLRAAME